MFNLNDLKWQRHHHGTARLEMYITTILNAFMERTFPKKTAKGEAEVILYVTIVPDYSTQRLIFNHGLPDGRLYY